MRSTTLVVQFWRPRRATEKDAGAEGRRMEYDAGTEEEEEDRGGRWRQGGGGRRRMLTPEEEESRGGH